MSIRHPLRPCTDVDLDSNLDIVEALEDTRSETFGNPKRMRDINHWGKYVFQSVYVTPRFLQHFDLFTVNDPDVL